MFEVINYSSCRSRSSENIIRSSSGDAQGKRNESVKRGWNSVYHTKIKKMVHFWVSPPLKANVLFCRFFWNLTRFQTKLRVLVLRLPDFTENSDKSTPLLQAFCSLNAWSRALYAQKHTIGLGTLVPWPVRD
jgi:hypothetical protein